MESIWLSFFGPFDLFVHLGGIYGIELLNQVKYINGDYLVSEVGANFYYVHLG